MLFEYPYLAHFPELAPPRLRPLLWKRLQRIHHYIGDAFDLTALRILMGSHQHELWRTPELASLGHELIAPERMLEERVLGCVWLTHFPSLETVAAMRGLLIGPEAESLPVSLRSQAAWTLGYRQERQRDGSGGGSIPRFSWDTNVRAAADAALTEAFLATLTSIGPMRPASAMGPGATMGLAQAGVVNDAAKIGTSAPAQRGKEHVGFRDLPLFSGALRSVDSPALDEAFAQFPLEAAPAIEAFASPELARILLSRLDELGAEDAPRIIRLIGEVLGKECVAPLLEYAARAPMAEKCEALFAALTISREEAQPALTAFIKTLAFPQMIQTRARWHEENPGIFPTVRALRIARTTALIDPQDRASRCALAAADFAALADKDGMQWSYLQEFWRQMAYGGRAASHLQVINCVEATAAGTVSARADGAAGALSAAPFLVAPYLEALAAEGRFGDLINEASRQSASDLAALLLAQRGRPFLALAARRRARLATPEAVAAQALALFLGGRPDLAQRTLENPPRTSDDARETFPSADDCWRMNFAPRETTLLRAVADRSLSALLTTMVPAPPQAEMDSFDLAELAACEKTLSRDLSGKSLALIGDFGEQEGALRARLEGDFGAQIVSGPFARAEFFLAGKLDAERDHKLIAKLQDGGAVSLRLEDFLPRNVEPLMPAIPYRCVFLAPVLTMPPGAEGLSWASSVLLDTTIFQHLIRHPRVAIPDPDDSRWDLGAEEELETAKSENFEEILADKFRAQRRDEVLWFELAIDPAKPVTARLRSRRFDGTAGEFAAIGAQTLGEMIESCISQWLKAAGLVPAGKLEQFAVEDFLNAAQEIEAFAESRRNEKNHDVQVPQALTIPFAHALFTAFGELPPAAFVYEQDKTNPWALREHFMKEVHEKPTKRDEIRQAIKNAPQYGKAYLSMFGEDVTEAENLDGMATAAMLLPGQCYALQNYAAALHAGGRYEEAYRLAERSMLSYALHFPAHLSAMQATLNIGRTHEEVSGADGRVAFMEKLVKDERLEAQTPEIAMVRLEQSEAYLDVGRLDEAIQIRRDALEKTKATREKWPRMFALLDDWEKKSEILANAYAREAWHRGDPGRVVEGYSRAQPLEGPDVAKLIESLLTLGKDEEALYAAAHFQSKNISRRWEPRAAAAKALIANGRLAQALEQIQTLQLRTPQVKFDAEINRLLRFAATRPLEEWDAAIAQRMQAGALRLAKLLARDAADFVPGADKSAIIPQALSAHAPDSHLAHAPDSHSAHAPVPYDAKWLEVLKAAVEIDVSKVDALFANLDAPLGADEVHGAETLLARADRLVNAWPDATMEDDGSEFEGRRVLYLTALALCRYLAATTQTASPITGALRQIATDAIFVLPRFASDYPDEMLAPFLAAIDACGSVGAQEGHHGRGGTIDLWILDSWLLRIERALDLEANHGAHTDPLTDPLPLVGALLRGDERVGFELRMARETGQDQNHHEQSRKLLERSFRAFGSNAAYLYSEQANLSLPPAQALDVHWTAHAANPTFIGIGVNLGRALFANTKVATGVEIFSKTIGFANKDLRKKHLNDIAGLWAQANPDMPFDFSSASTRATQAMQTGDFAGAIPLLRWCDAIDPNNKVTLRNLGIAHARLGQAFESLAAFAEADFAQGPNWAGQALREAQKYPEAMAVYKYASLYFRSKDEWLALSGVAWYAEDDETAALAYGKARELGELDTSQMHSYATVLNAIGRYDDALKIGGEVVAAAGSDPTYSSCGEHAVARALVGLGRGAEGVPHATQAVKLNPLADNKVEFDETLARCQRNEAWPKKSVRGESEPVRAAKALEAGDFAEAEKIAASKLTFPGLRIHLASTEFRFESENARPVSEKAARAVDGALGATAGFLDSNATLARIRALRIRENGVIQLDPPPPLGARMSAGKFRELFDARSGAQAPKGPPKIDMAKAQAQAAAAMAKMQAGQGGDADPVVFPGAKVAKLSDYVKLMKGMQAGNMMGALAAAGLDMGAYGQVAMQWSQKMAQDPSLSVKMAQMMMKP